MKTGILKTDVADVFYLQQGEGPDIVWIPGGDQTGEEWAEQMAAFPDCRNTSFDPPDTLFYADGQGQPSYPSPNVPYQDANCESGNIHHPPVLFQVDVHDSPPLYDDGLG